MYFVFAHSYMGCAKNSSSPNEELGSVICRNSTGPDSRSRKRRTFPRLGYNVNCSDSLLILPRQLKKKQEECMSTNLQAKEYKTAGKVWGANYSPEHSPDHSTDRFTLKEASLKKPQKYSTRCKEEVPPLSSLCIAKLKHITFEPICCSGRPCIHPKPVEEKIIRAINMYFFTLLHAWFQ